MQASGERGSCLLLCSFSAAATPVPAAPAPPRRSCGLPRPARSDTCEEDVGGSVLGLRCRLREDGSEAALAQAGQSLVLTEPEVAGGPRRGAEIERPGHMGLVPGAAAVIGVREPDVGGACCVTRTIVAVVVPGDSDGDTAVDGDRRLERKRGGNRNGCRAAPGEAAVS